MNRMVRSAFARGLLAALGTSVGGTSAASAQEVLLRNDDMPLDFATAAISLGFGAGDVAAATFTLTPQQQAALLPMRVKRVQVAWMSYNNVLFGQPATPVAMESINVYRGGYTISPFAAPQLVYFSDPPQMQDSSFQLNEFNIAADDVILQAPLTKFTVGLCFVDEVSNGYYLLNTFAKPSVVYDQTNNAIRNPVFDPALGWKDYIEYGGTGDIVIRVVVERAAPAACNLADLTAVGGPPFPPDGQLTLDDILAFVNAYSDSDGCPDTPGTPCNIADVVGVGGPPAEVDGQLTLDDIIAFVNAYSEGC